jgi:outer membrane immunogenic protein
VAKRRLNTFLSLAALAGICSAPSGAAAADLNTSRSTGSATPALRAPIWEGVYAGVGLDFTGSATELRAFGTARKYEATKSDITGSLFLGYNFQSGPWVYGVEADWMFLGTKISKADPTLGTVKTTQGNLASLRGRGGYAFDNLLVYGTLGVAFLDREIKATAGGSNSDVQTGIVLGVGAEYMFSQEWTGRVEALAYGFGEDDVVLGGVTRKVSDGVGTIRVGIARKF